MKDLRDDDRLLQEYLDGELPPEAVQRLEKQLAESSGLRSKLEAYKLIHRTISGSSLVHPSDRFVSNVMSGVGRVQTSSHLSPRNGLFLIVGVLLAAGILAYLLSQGFFAGTQTTINIGIPQGGPEALTKIIEKAPELPSAFTLHGKLLLDGVIGAALIMSLLILDRTVLRPYFQRRAGVQL